MVEISFLRFTYKHCEVSHDGRCLRNILSFGSSDSIFNLEASVLVFDLLVRMAKQVWGSGKIRFIFFI